MKHLCKTVALSSNFATRHFRVSIFHPTDNSGCLTEFLNTILKKLFAFRKSSPRQITVLAVCVCAFSQNVFAQSELFKTPAALLRGADAVNELKENGQYESLINAVNALDQGSVLFYVNAPTGVTAAGVTIGGRVTTGKSKGIPKTNVYTTDTNGQTRTTQKNAFGYYSFANTNAGQTFTLTAVSKRYTFGANVVTATEDLANIDFIAER